MEEDLPWRDGRNFYDDGESYKELPQRNRFQTYDSPSSSPLVPRRQRNGPD